MKTKQTHLWSPYTQELESGLIQSNSRVKNSNLLNYALVFISLMTVFYVLGFYLDI